MHTQALTNHGKSKGLRAAKLNVTKNTHGEELLKGSPQKLLIPWLYYSNSNPQALQPPAMMFQERVKPEGKGIIPSF